jgi:Tol biopolymer transport system component
MRPLTRESDPRIVIGAPFWSPRGDWIQFPATRKTNLGEATYWLARPDGSDARDLEIGGGSACWSGDGKSLYYSDREKGVNRIRKVAVAGGQPVTVRDDNATGCALVSDGSTLYFAKILTQATGAADFEIRAARPEDGPSQVIGRVAGSRVPVSPNDMQPYLSPDGKWLALPLVDGSTTNLWALPTSGGEWRKLTDFGSRNVVIARRIAWSKDGKSMYAAVSDVDSDIVMFSGLKW